MPAEATLSKLELVRSVCRDSLFQFVRRFWPAVSKEEPVWNWHIPYLCEEFQALMERVFRGDAKEHDLIVNIPPGTTKSTVASVMLLPWAWTRMASCRAICGSYAHALAMDLSRKSRDVVKCDLYRACFPEIKLREDQDTKTYFANTEGGARCCVSVGGAVMGMHAHVLVVDDPIDPRGARSTVELNEANHWMDETLSGRKIDKRVTPTALIMQRLAQNDPTGHRKEKKDAGKVRHVCLPAELSDKVSPRELRSRYVKGLLDPVRLPVSVLSEALADLGQFGYSGQYRQDPIPLGEGMFIVDRLKIGHEVPDQFKRVVRHWDKAGVEGGKGAFTVGAKVGIDSAGRIWILDIVRGRWESSRREGIILTTAQLDGKSVTVQLEQEPGSGGKESAEATARRLAGFRVLIDRPTGDKALRADPFSVQVNAHNVYLAPGPWNAELISEMSYFPFSKFKDQIDAVSAAFSAVTKPRVTVGGLG